MADHVDSQLPPAAGGGTEMPSSAGSSVTGGSGDDEATVLTRSPALEAEEFPQGLSPRELALTLKGQLLDHFHLQEFIGGGGMGAVFKALDTTLDRIVAVKVVASQSISSEDLQRRFLIEAQSTARLDHPNIARIHFVGRDRGLPYIVFEYIEGVNLRDLVVNHGPVPLGDALSFTCQIAHALAHAWQKEVVHRDIKPSNILITHEGQAKLVDMGLARVHQVGAVENDLTSTGVTLGTFDYISPEQARDPREADTRSDIYSLGCTLFYMLAGRPPFAEGTAVQKLLKHQDQEPPSLSRLRPEISESVSQLIRRMLAKAPERRPQTPSDLLVDCYSIFQELSLSPPMSLPPLPIVSKSVAPSVWRTHLPWAIPLLALLAITPLWMGGALGPGETVEFAPIQRPAAEPPKEERSPDFPLTDTPDNSADSTNSATETADQNSPTLGAQPRGSISISSIFDDPIDIEPQNGVLSLLEFPLSPPADIENAPDDLQDWLDLDNVLGAD